MPLSTNQPAPDFVLRDENGAPRSLADYRGKPVILYFYPKDDTPGCTTEACNFRDDYAAYENAGVVILGVSPDSPKSHKKFKEKYNLPFTLLADEDHKVAELYGVWGPKKLLGRAYYGILRTTFLIDTNGNIKRIFENVKPADHSAEVLQALAE
ncbi:MAG: thioredoxin-dependent thiol peroxidase [Anaerolineaceae bacterium]